MVGWAPAPPSTPTTGITWQDATGTSTDTSSWGNTYYYTSTYRPPDKKADDDEEKAIAKQAQIKKMRSTWKMTSKSHDFKQRKWSTDKPRGRR